MVANEVTPKKMIQLKDDEFFQIKELVHKNFGIFLTEQKKNLVMTRLQKILATKGFPSFRDYYNYVVTDKSGSALSELANAISTNHTYFYREKDHFEFFKQTALPEIVNMNRVAGDNDVRIWCAGCSTGEEPYNLVMQMLEFFGMDYNNWRAGILATDISERALLIAKRGVYSKDRIVNLPEDYKRKYFKKISNDEFEVVDKLKQEVLYRRFNLMNPQFIFKKKFHSIFCRNVMIYFDEPTRIELVNKFYDLLVPGGYLFIGHSESLKRDTHKFNYVMPALYQK